jgi:hypothetical protein
MNDYFTVENTGWSDGVSWFEVKQNRFDARFPTYETALEYIERNCTDDSAIRWRIAHIVVIHFEDGFTVTTKYTEIK